MHCGFLLVINRGLLILSDQQTTAQGDRARRAQRSGSQAWPRTVAADASALDLDEDAKLGLVAEASNAARRAA
jgi:hypothetical protein